MKLYEINAALEELLENAVDPETGELVIDADELQALQMQRDEKLEGLAVYYKNLVSEAAALKAEIDTLTKRKTEAEKKAERIKQFLATQLDGQALKSPRVAVSFRRVKSVEVTDERRFWDWQNYEQFVTFPDPKISKTKIRAAMDAGETVPGCELVEKQSITIK